ncbi:restriction endonuclease subunit S [Bradyrhizobium liaoningense]|uniref:restriction endonuclease subunit S n=1 Tax=Bradyrhizobium TaxID=374 RepID=UPI001BA6AAB9|nr:MULTISPECIES: restriction endonuclease subunit S [Bradyrhizobium]MBR0878552.1 restriction endonuclease subunit S [Bradyrhizobium liaoningense]UQD98227.1 restriction endonuclease subunit S [Bradyrhizobium japonicum]
MNAITSDWESAALSDVVSIEIGRTPSRAKPQYWGGSTKWLTISDYKHGDRIEDTSESISDRGVRECGMRIHPPGTLVMSFKLTIGKLGIIEKPMATNEAIAALKPRSCEQLDSRYLFHFLSQFNFDSHIDRAAKGGTLNKAKLQGLRITFPKVIGEQRRLAAILDRADGIRRKRDKAIGLVDGFLMSVFYDSFGGQFDNPKDHSVKSFGSMLCFPLRNGISPSSKGQVDADVLTLSAITGNGFDYHQRKSGRFIEPISAKDVVSDKDFYICRGNGSPELVGKGVFASQSMPGVAFPDTMIAARPDPGVLQPGFLETTWNSPFVRNQIIAAARTTNGTFKVNQTAVENIKFPVPPIDDQLEFEQIWQKCSLIKKRLRTEVFGDAALFASLSQRAFRGEL